MKIILIGWIVMTAIIGLMGCGERDIRLDETKAQQTAIYYLYHRALIADTFSRTLWNMPIDFRGMDSEKRLLYFIFKRDLGRAKVLQAMAIDTSNLEFAPCDSGVCDFGGMSGVIDGYYAFRIPISNLKIDSNIQFKCNLAKDSFYVSFAEVSQVRDSAITYPFENHIEISKFIHQSGAASNIGSFISMKDKDIIIKRLALKLTEGLTTKEEKAQKLLDFVSEQIAYSYEDHWYQTEITKRAHEVLIAGEADCSGKSTLYASLLDQCSIPYSLLYFDHHINVGVRGNFKNENAYTFKIKKDIYYMAETTVPLFQIGESKLQNHEILDKVLFYSRPTQSKYVYDAITNEKLVLIDHLEENE